MDCLGCRIAGGLEPGVQIVYENERVACVLDIAPFNEGHLLILPKAHAVDVEELDPADAYAIMDASRILSAVLKKVFKPDGITVYQGGIFNELGHYHMHLIPRYEGDGFTWGEPAVPHDAGRRLHETREKIVKALNEGNGT